MHTILLLMDQNFETLNTLDERLGQRKADKFVFEEG